MIILVIIMLLLITCNYLNHARFVERSIWRSGPKPWQVWPFQGRVDFETINGSWI